MTIGRVAAAAGVSVETIRYYQRRGLLEEPAKPIGGYRRYPPEMVNRICFIKRAQVLGFTLEDVAGLLRLDNREAVTADKTIVGLRIAKGRILGRIARYGLLGAAVAVLPLQQAMAGTDDNRGTLM